MGAEHERGIVPSASFKGPKQVRGLNTESKGGEIYFAPLMRGAANSHSKGYGYSEE